MKLTVTGITDTTVTAIISTVATEIENVVSAAISSEHYGAGVDKFVVFLVAVEDDPVENERYCVSNNRVGRIKDYATGLYTKFVGIAVPIAPSEVLKTPNIRKHMERLIVEEIASPAYAMPKGFNREKLLADFRVAFEADI